MPEFRMPSLGADMEFGIINGWHVKPGDQVKKGDIVAVVETEKSSLEVEIFESGTVDQILVPVGTRVPVGAVLATLRNGEGAVPVPRALAVTPGEITPIRPQLPFASCRSHMALAPGSLPLLGAWPASWASIWPRSQAPGRKAPSLKPT